MASTPPVSFSMGVLMMKNENVEGEPAYDETYRRGPVVMRGPMIP